MLFFGLFRLREVINMFVQTMCIYKHVCSDAAMNMFDDVLQ